jgi:DNA-directed RNA polymerase specialized sigma24 family protein
LLPNVREFHTGWRSGCKRGSALPTNGSHEGDKTMVKHEMELSNGTTGSQLRAIGTRPFFRGPAGVAASSPHRELTIRTAGGRTLATVPAPAATAAPAAAEGEALDQDAWTRLLSFLTGNRPERAGSVYGQLHDRLVRYFRSKGSTHAEELADATLDRVARKLSRETTLEIANPTGYVLGVARLIWLERVKLEVGQRHRLDNHEATRSDENDDEKRERERQSALLERCLGELPAAEREMLLRYYEGRGQARIATRQALVAAGGLNPGLLRTRVCRLRAQLGRRVHALMAQQQAA